MILFFDTETTGKCDFNKPPTWDGQPDVRQLAFQLYTMDGTRPLHSFACIVKPYGIPCSKEATDKHGITDEVAEAIGVKPRWALDAFMGMLQHTTVLVGHNVK